MSNSKEFIEYVARCLVDNRDAIEVRETDSASLIIYELKVAPEDKGRIIGRQGQVVNAIRTLLRVMAAKEGKRATLEIL